MLMPEWVPVISLLWYYYSHFCLLPSSLYLTYFFTSLQQPCKKIHLCLRKTSHKVEVRSGFFFYLKMSFLIKKLRHILNRKFEKEANFCTSKKINWFRKNKKCETQNKAKNSGLSSWPCCLNSERIDMPGVTFLLDEVQGPQAGEQASPSRLSLSTRMKCFLQSYGNFLV